MSSQQYAAWLDWLSERSSDRDVESLWVDSPPDLDAEVLTTDPTNGLDVRLVCRDGHGERVAASMLRSAQRRFLITHTSLTHQDGGVRIWLSTSARPGLLPEPIPVIELRICEVSDRRLVESERRAGPLVFTDRDNLVPPTLDEASIARLQDEQQELGKRLEFLEWDVRRAIRADDDLAASEVYLREVIRRLVRMLRAHACPWQVESGLRLLASDVGAERAQRVTSLLPHRDLEERLDAALAWLRALASTPILPGWADRDRAVLSVPTRHSPTEIWAALTSTTRLQSWLGTATTGLDAGVSFELKHYSNYTSTHAVQLWEPSRLLGLSWAFPDEAPSRVDLTVSDAGRLTVEHTGLADPVGYAAGWHRHLDFLLAHLDGNDLAIDSYWDGQEALESRYRELHERLLRVPNS